MLDGVQSQCFRMFHGQVRRIYRWWMAIISLHSCFLGNITYMSLPKNIVAQKSYGLSCVLSNMVIWGYTRIPWYMGLSENGETTTSHGTLNTVHDSPMHSEVAYFIP